MWAIISALIEGLILGVIARLLIPGKQNIPLWLTVLLGLVGAIVGNLVAHLFGVADTRGFDWWRHAFQLGAAVVLIVVITPLWAARNKTGP
ncbi:GlsB/YeaQ/YmgE family stress response membrane protein [Saccharothrix sp. ST-888]|uniref:GlsB/YeaQ/YmgE family stress response membrane protein n=1 Tax=Saccharothrix sp. ST-888 TaxID=1427391 RepID=UPI0005EC3B75|nr:GlsB/YeaQ/YmgE family stress response membrane protein [Saccharothrix sp. ST-888]KJK57275.1 signal peptide protein [Saccharothrix sp. ST-888]